MSLNGLRPASMHGLVMAGGAGSRMRASGAQEPKPLVAVGGVSVLERNIAALVRAGVRDVTVAASRGHEDIARFVDGAAARVRAVGGTLGLVQEDRPLGSLGVAGIVGKDEDHVVVVNADNVTALDLRRVVEHHVGGDAAMTIGVHREAFTMPFGRVVADVHGRVRAYDEKPTATFTVSSAVCVLAPAARDELRPPRFVMLADFVNGLLTSGAHVASFPHDAPWVDVNDLAARQRAEVMVAADPDRFPTLASLATTGALR